MGIRSRNCGDRLRTVWTPEMDRYFIDLMLEQVNSGNKFDDHLFSKRAWRNMTGSFNSKFEARYEKDVLKNRYKTLRNLYKAVRNLIEQRGFSWDETRQMVTAENSVWDEYIKEHPDARSFRIKTIPYYNDLCLIYKDSVSEQKGDNTLEESLLSCEKGAAEVSRPRDIGGDGEPLALHDIIVDEDYGITMLENEGNPDVPPQIVTPVALAGRTRTYWQPPMDRYFIDLMLCQIRKGNTIDGVFRKQAWPEMIVLFNEKFGFSYDADVIKNRYKTLKRQYHVVKNLLDLDGFVWDDSRQMVTADDHVWQDYIKAHSDARQFMTRPIPYFKDLCTICDPNLDEREGSSGQDSEEYPESHPTTTLISNENKKNNNKRETDHLSASLSYSKRSRNDADSMSIESVIEAVQALPDMEDDFVLDACDLLEDEKKAKTFMALDEKLRRKWLLRKLRPETIVSKCSI